MKKLFSLLLAALLLLRLIPPVSAATPLDAATKITEGVTLSGTGYSSFGFLTDGNTASYVTSNGNTELTVESKTPFASLYLLFDLEYGTYTVTDNNTNQVLTAGEHSFLHDYVELENTTTSVTLRFENGKVRLSELQIFTEGSTPEDVQNWNAPLDSKADIVLFASHGDDDQLFFAGLLPHYAAQPDCGVQVVYMTDHRNLTHARTHEMLNGLWSVGITAYPVFGSFADFRIDDLQGTYDHYKNIGTSQEDLQSFVVENIRRFKPQVAITHALNGEYGHGMHMAYADLLIKALELTNDPEKFPESAAQYGLWDIPKTYLHLYEENPIVLDYDQPLPGFDGLTAFQVTQKLGYPCHESQQYTWFTRWINWVGMAEGGTPVTSATQIEKYSPCQFGLYRSTVGEDVNKNDFLENIVTYAEQERLEQERLEQERLEQERLEQERLEQERLEQERLEQERLEQERLEQERLEQERLEQERLEQAEAQRRKELTVAVILLLVLIAALICVLVVYGIRRQRHRRRRAFQRKNKNLP